MQRPGFHLYAMGPEGIGKHTLVRQYLTDRAAREPVPPDWCYVNDPSGPRRPRAVQLPAGEGRRLRDRVARLLRELPAAIPVAFDAEDYRNRRQALEDGLKRRREEALEDFERRAMEQGVALIRTPAGFALGPVRNGKPVPQEEFDRLPEDERRATVARVAQIDEELGSLIRRSFPVWEREYREQVRQLERDTIRSAIEHLIEEVSSQYRDLPEVHAHLERVQQDLEARAEEFIALATLREQSDAPATRVDGEQVGDLHRYQVNLVVDHAESTGAPVVYDDAPTQPNLIGRIEYLARMGTIVTDFTLIRAGDLHRANGGYLVLEARRLLQVPFAWEDLKRMLRAGEVRIEQPADRWGLLSTASSSPSRSRSSSRSS
jgi:predicted ATP-dependent protease